MKPAPVRYAAPGTIDEACDLAARYGDGSEMLAGGQSLGPLLNLRLSTPEVLIDLGRIPELAEPPTYDGHTVTIPAMTRQYAAETSGLIHAHVPLLTHALPYVAHRTIRNRGTVGGSVAHADPSAEIPAVAVAANAKCALRSATGSRVVAADTFFDGYFTTVMEPDEVLTHLTFPARRPREGNAWAEFAPRRGDFAIVGVGVVLRLSPADGSIAECRIAYSGVADHPWLASDVTDALVGEEPTDALFSHIASEAANACSPMTDSVGSASYRKNLVRYLTRSALNQALPRTREGYR